MGGSAEDADARVRAQYEALPYPERDPRDEAKRLVIGSPSDLAEMNHHVFAGRRDFSRPFRALVAGGGTGDGLVMLAQQLADAGCPAEIAYLDLSGASRGVAEARCAARGLGHVRFVTGSLLDVAALVPGPWDYVDCCGVLHHLADPGAGLAALAGQLAPDGGMGLMVYGTYGRRGVYEVQAMLRALATPQDGADDRLATARALLRALPPTNGLARNPFVGDHRDGTDAGLYDLLLHERDRAYTVPEIAALAAGAGLRIAAFIEPARYDPDTWLPPGPLRDRLAGRPWIERCAFAERLAGNLRKHVFYVVPQARPGPVAAMPEPGAVPLFRQGTGAAYATAARRSGALAATVDGLAMRFTLPRRAPAILQRIDGIRCLADMEADMRRHEPGLTAEAFAADLQKVYAAYHGCNLLLLRFPPGSG